MSVRIVVGHVSQFLQSGMRSGVVLMEEDILLNAFHQLLPLICPNVEQYLAEFYV